MTTLASLGAVLRDLVWLTIVEPVRQGRLRTVGWPIGLRPIVLATLAVYAAVALSVIFATPLRRAGHLLVTTDGTTIPDAGASLCIGAIVLSLALFQSAALHLPWWVRLASLLVTAPVVIFFVIGVGVDPVMLIPAAVGLLVLVVMTLVRARAHYAWWEFVVVALALATAVFVPTLGSGQARSLGFDWRGSALVGALQTLTSLAMPALFVAGAALAQIAVTASFATVAASTRELRPAPLRIVGVLLLAWAVVAVVGTLTDPENTVAGWVASGTQLAVLALLWSGVATLARRTPTLTDLSEDSTRLNYLIALSCTAYVMLSPVMSILREVARVAGMGWLFTATDGYVILTRSDWIVSAVRALVGLVGLLLVLRLARRGRSWAALFLGALLVLAVFDLLRLTELSGWIRESVAQFSTLLLISLLGTAGWQLLSRRLSGRRMAALASGVLLCLVFPHRAILDDPISALLGFSGIAAVLFGLIWRVLTEGDITREGTARWPVPSRVLLYCASALLAVTSTAFVALTRGSGSGSLDITAYTEAGDSLLGTPLFLTAALGCLAIAIAPVPAASGRRDMPSRPVADEPQPR